MHDIDQTMTDFEDEMGELEFEGGYEDEEEMYDDEFDYEDVSPFDESEEMELAAELMEVADDEELEMFLGKLVKRVGRRARKFVRRRVGRNLNGVLRKVAKRALPIAGRAAGTFIGGPAGGAIGSRVARHAGKVFGLELEGLSPEDSEFETAKGFVRFAGAAARKAAAIPPTMPAAQAVKKAVVSAARSHAPGLVGIPRTSTMPPAAYGSKRGGRWVRRGNRIILMGV
jgi:uncharacterized protein (DUF697 family)